MGRLSIQLQGSTSYHGQTPSILSKLNYQTEIVLELRNTPYFNDLSYVSMNSNQPQPRGILYLVTELLDFDNNILSRRI